MNIADLNYLICSVANILDIVSYISSDILMLRLVLVGASILFIWSAVIVPDAESLFFNVIYLLINFIQVVYLLWLMRPVEFGDEDIENVYNKLFAPPLTAMSKLDFQILCESGFLRKLYKGDSYCEDGSMVDNLSILISGKIECIRYEIDKYGKRHERVVNSIGPLEFIESPQWLTRRKEFDQSFVGRMKAAEGCRYLTWKLDELDVLILRYPQYKSYIDAVVGCDVAQKILKMDANLEELADDPQPHVHVHEPPPSTSDPFKLNPAITAAYNREYGIADHHEPPVTVDQGMSQNRSLIFGGSVHRRHNPNASKQGSPHIHSHLHPHPTQHQHHHHEEHVHVSLSRSIHLRKTIGDMLSGSVHHKPHNTNNAGTTTQAAHTTAHTTSHVHFEPPPSHSHSVALNESELHPVLSPLRHTIHHSNSYQSIPTLDNTNVCATDGDGGITEPSDHHMYVVNEDAGDDSNDDY